MTMLTEPIQSIGTPQLLLTGLLVGLVIALSFYEHLRIERDFLVGTFRTFAQLFLVGYVLEYIFALNRWYLVLLILAVMLVAACQAGVGRLKQRERILYPTMLLSLAAGAGLTILVVTEIILQIEPWYNPRYLIPLAGMIIGNAMTGATLGAERFRSEIMLRKGEVETLLSLGFDAGRASAGPRQKAMTAALLPTLNSMMVVGLVSLPGMMTGQILSGTSPVIAVRYQIVVMLMIACAVMISSFVMVKLLARHFFTGDHQLRYDLLTP